MSWLLRGPFRRRLALAMTATSVVSLLVASGALLFVESRRARASQLEGLATLVELVAANSVGALTFGDANAARENVSALAVRSDIVLAALYTADGRVLAVYRRPGGEAEAPPPAPRTDEVALVEGRLGASRVVRMEGDPVGAVRIEAEPGSWVHRMQSYVATLLLVMASSAAAAGLLAARLQRTLSTPLERLTGAARSVADSGDYSVRVPAAGDDELGVLTAAFNGMLARIEEQDWALRSIRDELERRVEDRVGDLRREIREREQAEQAMRASEAKYRQLVETTSEWIWSVDAEGRWTYNNPAVERILGYRPEELLGRSSREFLHAQELDRAEALGAHSSPESAWSGVVLRWCAKDGRYRSLETTGAPMFDAQGRLAGFHGLDRDITDRLVLEEQLRQAQKMEAVGRLAGGIAHDFNNLLAVILGYVDLLQRKTPGEPRLQQIQRAAERAAGLTKQLLAFSRRQVLSPRFLDPNDVLAETESMLRRLIGEDVELAIRPGYAVGHVLADPVQVQQLLMNLSVNARDAMPQGGRLTIETDDVDVDDAAARAEPGLGAGRFVRLKVSDTGCGMDKETLDHIFEPFFTTKAQGKGTGLGLATVYGVVKQSGGHIAVRSTPGAGTCFSVYLPRVDAPAGAQRAEEARPAPPERGRETILLVEDEPSLRELTRDLLEAHGYRVLACADGREALTASGRHSAAIGLLLTDVVMPGMNGRELAERLLRERPSLRVLYMSGYTDDAILRRGVPQGSSQLLQKPFNEAMLLRRVQQALASPVVTMTSGGTSAPPDGRLRLA